MASDDDSEQGGVDESTKQVDRNELSAALNKSVDSREVLDRVNRDVDGAMHAEGTARVDRSTVEEYLAAAKSGEFPAAEILKGKTDSNGDAEPATELDETEGRDESGRKTAVSVGSPGSTKEPATLSPPPQSPPMPAATAQNGGLAGDAVSEVSMTEVQDLQGPVEARRHDRASDTEEAQLSDSPSAAPTQVTWAWILVLAVLGILLGVGVGLLYLFLVSSG